MSRVVLDTHVVVWLVNGDPLSQEALAAIDSAADTNDVLISAITLWEIGMLVAKNRLVFTSDVQEWVDRVLALRGVTLAPLDPAIAIASTRLPGEVHGDPADRIIIATARGLQATLITADATILAYGAAGYVDILNAR